MENTNTKKTKAKEKLWGKMYKGGTSVNGVRDATKTFQVITTCLQHSKVTKTSGGIRSLAWTSGWCLKWIGCLIRL